ncbi:Ferric reductase like transmembrane component [Streptomyces qinglanensis]|uniref:Ferric reductase like transmembrane component n=1 Tax=Streptomyces qinglanensis TaxID=943816 RepID=A0A1H9UW51_9ACTN|nr:Ferric reductase like transmembrane component [Streptomyces qinglanensis]
MGRTFIAAPRSWRRPRSIVLGATALVLLFTAAILLAPGAHAAGMSDAIPGSPLDAHRKQIPYDNGVHKIARVTALVAYALMVATVLFGFLLRLRFLQRAIKRSTAYGAHMSLGLSALIFGAMHGLTFLYQPVWRIGVSELITPFSAELQRFPVGFGVLGTELAVAVTCALWLQRWLGYHRWLRFHQFAYAAFFLVWLHVFTVHPEPRHLGLVAVLVAGGATACLLLFLIRVFPPRSRQRQESARLAEEIYR